MDKPERIIDLEVRIKRALLILLYMAIAVGAVLILYFGRAAIQFTLTVLSPFLVALIVAYIFNPVIRILQIRFRIRRLPAILITYGIILTLTIVFFAILVLSLIHI